MVFFVRISLAILIVFYCAEAVAQCAIEKAKELYNSGDEEGALLLINEELAKTPEDQYLLKLKGRILIDLDDTLVLKRVAELYTYQDKNEDAIPIYEKLAEMTP